jgi:quercetin dioxygenase-like cupin family protein
VACAISSSTGKNSRLILQSKRFNQHPQQEASFILEGRAEYAAENGTTPDWEEVNHGDMINIPPGAIHGFRNESGRDAKFSVCWKIAKKHGQRFPT